MGPGEGSPAVEKWLYLYPDHPVNATSVDLYMMGWHNFYEPLFIYLDLDVLYEGESWTGLYYGTKDRLTNGDPDWYDIPADGDKCVAPLIE